MQASIIKIRSTGAKVEISAKLHVYYNSPSWEISVYVCDPGKRKYRGVWSESDYTYRILNTDDRHKYVLDKQLQYCSIEEMLEAKMKAWEALKPTL